MADLTEKAREIFADLDQEGSPGATCAVVKDGEVVLTTSTGYASLEHRVPNRQETSFQIASTSKQFTACSIALLENQGALSLEDDVREYVPELAGIDEVIRIHHLIHHTSGLREIYELAAVGGLPEQSYGTGAGTLELLSRQRTLNFPPGSQYMYSNSGYFLMAEIVSRISGESLQEFAQKRIFQPAGMNDTIFRDDPTLVIPNRASGYRPDKEGGWSLYEHTGPPGPGGIFTTVQDLARWDTALYGGVLEPSDIHERLLRTRPLTTGKPTNYAYGLVLGTHRGLRTVSHGGGAAGYSAEFLRYPDEHLTVICLANTSAAASGERARRVAELYLGDRMQPARTREPMTSDATFDAKFAGLYVSEQQTNTIEINVEDRAVSMTVGAWTNNLQPTARNVVVSPMGFEMVFDGSGISVNSTEDEEEFEGLSPRYVRVLASEDVEADLEVLAGTYRSDELDREIEIKEVEGEWTIARGREESRPLKLIGRDLVLWPISLQSIEVDLLISIVRDGNQRPAALKIGLGKSRGTLFHRQ